MNVALRPDSFNLISLCTGGGGLDLGVELAMPGARSVVLVEREAFAASQLVSAIQQGLMAEAAIWSDVTTFNGRPWRGLVDGLIGGIPCQPHSLAGKRQGSDDERDLWSDARRIIVQSGAWFVLIENVSGMLSAKPGLDPGALRVRRDLQRLGFDVEGGLFTAAEVGASHERERVFILAVADPNRRQFAWRPAIRSEAAGRWPYTELAGSGHGLPGVGLADTDNTRLEGHRKPRERAGELPAWPCSGELVNTVGRGHDGRTNGEIGRSIGRTLTEGASQRVANIDGGLSNAERVAYSNGTESTARRNNITEVSDSSARTSRPEYSAAIFGGGRLFPPGPSDLRSWASILTSAPELEPAFRRVADGLASRLDVARVDRLRMLGNGVVPLQAAYALRTLATRLAASGSAGAARLIRMMNALSTQASTDEAS